MTFQVFVKTLTGITLTFDFCSNDPIWKVYLVISKKEGIPAEGFRLVFAGRTLEPNRCLSYYNIQKESTIHLILRHRGGCFVSGTKILVSGRHENMNDDSLTCLKEVCIENLVVGDTVLSYNLETKKFESSTIKDIPLISYDARKLVNVEFEGSSNTDIICTPSHPFWCHNKQNYCSIDNNYDKFEHKCEKYSKSFGKLEIGDIVLNSESKHIKIKQTKYGAPKWSGSCGGETGDSVWTPVRTLTLNGSNHNFFANGILVHNTSGKSNNGPDVETVHNAQVGHNNLLYYSVGHGLNYGGRCMNAQCRAYKQRVIMKRGFGEKIDPFDEIFEEEIKCPGCKKEFKLEEYVLYKCDCKIRFKKKGGDKKTAIHRPRDKEFVRLGVDEAGDKIKADYEHLKFNVYEPGKMPQ